MPEVEVFPPGAPRPEDHEKLIIRLARNASLQVLGRLAMLCMVPFIGFMAWVGVRIISELDGVRDKQINDAMAIVRIEAEQQRNRYEQMRLDNKIVETDNRNNARMTQISTWVQKVADGLDAMKEKVYPYLLLPKAK